MPPLMLTGEEALAVLLGLVAGRRAGLVTTSVAAAESAAAKVRRVLPEVLAGRLDALLATADFTVPSRPVVTPDTELLLRLADAARQRSPVAVTYTSWDGRRSERTVQPYGIVAHSGRWYVTGADSASGEVRTFRLDRIQAAAVQPGTFEVPAGFDPAATVLSGLAEVPRLHEVSVRVQATAEQVRARFSRRDRHRPRGAARARARPGGRVGAGKAACRAAGLGPGRARLAGPPVRDRVPGRAPRRGACPRPPARRPRRGDRQEANGKEANGKEANGKEANGKEANGKEATG